MTSVITKLFLPLLILSTFIAGCTGNSGKGSHLYLIPFLNPDGTYSWKEVELTTLDSPTRLSGSTATIHYKPTASNTFSGGPVVEPKMTKSGNVWVPLDTPSALALSAYANMEAIRRWEQSIDARTQAVYPRKIILEVGLFDLDGDMKNNAMYLPGADVVMFLPYSAKGIPLSVNAGIMAHEHFHTQFYHNVLTLNYEKNEWSTEADNERVLRAWNEGLADFYAYVFTKQARFMDVSKMPMFGGSIIRALDLDFISLSAEFMKKNSNDLIIINEKGDTCISGSPYCLGTQIGRMFYQMSQGDPAKARDLIRLLYDNFPVWEIEMTKKYEQEKIQTNDFLKWTFVGKNLKLDSVQRDVLRKAGVEP